jgi:hypothetical protein
LASAAPTVVWFSVVFDPLEFKRSIGRLPCGAFFIVYLLGLGFISHCIRGLFGRYLVGRFFRVAFGPHDRSLGCFFMAITSKSEKWPDQVLAVLGWLKLAHVAAISQSDPGDRFAVWIGIERSFGFATTTICFLAK